MKRVVIVGGGYAGVTLARELDAAFEVVLLERRDRFYHNVGAMRAVTDPALFRRLLMPYDQLLQRGRVVQDDVLSVGDGGVRAAGRQWDADAVVVATGSRHVLPFKSEFVDSADFLGAADSLSARLAAAGSVAILGDGRWRWSWLGRCDGGIRISGCGWWGQDRGCWPGRGIRDWERSCWGCCGA